MKFRKVVAEMDGVTARLQRIIYNGLKLYCNEKITNLNTL